MLVNTLNEKQLSFKYCKTNRVCPQTLHVRFISFTQSTKHVAPSVSEGLLISMNVASQHIVMNKFIPVNQKKGLHENIAGRLQFSEHVRVEAIAKVNRWAIKFAASWKFHRFWCKQRQTIHCNVMNRSLNAISKHRVCMRSIFHSIHIFVV